MIPLLMYAKKNIIVKLGLLLLLFCMSSIIEAQQRNNPPSSFLDRPDGFYQLINNQLQRLATQLNGKLTWQAVGEAFEISLKSLAYHPQEACFYSFDSLSSELIRIDRQGNCYRLGKLKVSSLSTPLQLNIDKAIIAGSYWIGYRVGGRQLYWIDLRTKTLEISEGLVFQTLQNLAYDSKNQLIWSLAADNVLYAMQPNIRRFWPYQQFINLDKQSTDPRGNLWLSSSNRFFVSRNQGSRLFELDLSSKLVYNWQNSPTLSEGDACSGSWANLPAFIQDDILEFYVEKRSNGALMLKWTGLREWANTSYLVQHSTDGQYWRDLKTIPSAGMKAYQNPYGHQFWPIQGQDNYFRLLKANSLNNGQFSRTIIHTETPKMVLFDCPFVGGDQTKAVLQIKGYKGQRIEVQLRDRDGRLVGQKKLRIYNDEHYVDWSLATIKSGFYTIVLISQKKCQRWDFSFFKRD